MQCLVPLLNVLSQIWQVYFLLQFQVLVFFLNHKHTFFNWESPRVLFAIFTSGCLSTRNSLSVNLDSRVLFPFPNKLENERSTEPKTQHFLGPPWCLTSTLWSQFNIWPSGCFWNMWLCHTSLALELQPVLAPLLRVIWLFRKIDSQRFANQIDIIFYSNVATKGSFLSRPAADGWRRFWGLILQFTQERFLSRHKSNQVKTHCRCPGQRCSQSPSPVRDML